MMKKVWLQLLAELRALGGTVVYASFYRVILATDKPSLATAKARCGVVWGDVGRHAVARHRQGETRERR